MIQSSNNRKASFKSESKFTNYPNVRDEINKDTKSKYLNNRILKINNTKKLFQNTSILPIKRILYNNRKKVFSIYTIIFSFFIISSIIPNILNIRIILSNSSSVILKIKGTGKKTYFNIGLYENCISFPTFPDEVRINDAELGLPINEYTFTRANNKIELIWNGDVTNLNCLFLDCSSINEMDFSKFDTSKVTTMIGMFYGCSGLKSLDLSYFNTNKVQNMNMLFINCHLLLSLNLSNFDTSQTTSIISMFESCSPLKELNLSYLKLLE